MTSKQTFQDPHLPPSSTPRHTRDAALKSSTSDREWRMGNPSTGTQQQSRQQLRRDMDTFAQPEAAAMEAASASSSEVKMTRKRKVGGGGGKLGTHNTRGKETRVNNTLKMEGEQTTCFTTSQLLEHDTLTSPIT